MAKRYSLLDGNKIFENTTDTIIEVSANVKEVCSKLNGGCGFNGHTPMFFANIMKERD